MTDATTFGQIVREARLAQGLSMGQLASAVGRTAAAVRSWERDEATPDGGVLERLAEILELDPDDLEDLAGAVAIADVDEAAAEDEVDPFAGIPGAHTGAFPIVEDATASSPALAPPDDPMAWSLRTFWDALLDPEQPILGYVRAGLTVVVGIVLLWMLVWAVGELFTALDEVLDGFGIG